MNKVKAVGRNVFVDVDALPDSLNLIVGQNLIFVRAFAATGNALLNSITMPAACFVVAGKVDHGMNIPGQPANTYIAGLALVNAEGSGDIWIRFQSRNGCSSSPVQTVRLPFTVRDILA